MSSIDTSETVCTPYLFYNLLYNQAKLEIVEVSIEDIMSLTYHGTACPRGHGTERYASNGGCVECCRLAAKRQYQGPLRLVVLAIHRPPADLAARGKFMADGRLVFTAADRADLDAAGVPYAVVGAEANMPLPRTGRKRWFWVSIPADQAHRALTMLRMLGWSVGDGPWAGNLGAHVYGVHLPEMTTTQTCEAVARSLGWSLRRKFRAGRPVIVK